MFLGMNVKVIFVGEAHPTAVSFASKRFLCFVHIADVQVPFKYSKLAPECLLLFVTALKLILLVNTKQPSVGVATNSPDFCGCCHLS